MNSKNYLMTTNFKSWFNGKNASMLDKANFYSKIMFNKDYKQLWSYQQSYIVKKLAGTLGNFKTIGV